MRLILLLVFLVFPAVSSPLPAVPEELVRITDAYAPDGHPPEFILVQDVHHHPEVQEKIARLILHAYERWDVHRVFMEGAFHRVDTRVFHRLPSSTQADLLSHLIKEGSLSGPEMAAVVVMEREWRNPSISTLQLLGMENARLYAKNLKLFSAVVSLREQALQEIGSLRRLQETLQLPEPNILRAQLDRAESLVKLQLTPAEYALYLSARDVLPAAPRLAPALKRAEEFYELVNHRSVEFLSRSRVQLPAGRGPRLLVVGGFHTSYMAECLREQKVPFIVLSPNITVPGNHSSYEKALLNSISTLPR